MKFLILLCSLSLFGSAASAQILNVVSTYPADGDFAVDTDSIVITFNQKINFDPLFLEESDFSFFIGPEDSVEKLGASLSEDSLSVIFYGNLAPNTDYVALLEYAEGINGEILESPYLFHFTTFPNSGQFVVEGYLTKEDLSTEFGENVIVYLSDESINIEFDDNDCMDEECDGDGEAEPMYASFADPTTGFYSIPSVREGTYFPIAIGLFFDDENSEDIIPELYFFDPDSDYEPNSFEINSTIAPNDTLSGIDLRKLELFPITFSEAVEIAQDEINNLENDPVIIGGGTYYAAFDMYYEKNGESNLKINQKSHNVTPTRFLNNKPKQPSYIEIDDDGEIIDFISTPNGLQIQWQIYGYDAVKDSVFSLEISPFGALFNEYIGAEDAELPEGVEFTSIKPLPEVYINSDEAASIIENAGGTSFRAQFSGEEGFWNMNLEALHSYWDYELDPTPNAPVMWRAEYSGFSYDPETSEYTDGYLLILLDIETGEVIYTDSEGGSFNPTSHITFDEAVAISDTLLDQLPNDPVIIGGATRYSSFDIAFNRTGKMGSDRVYSKKGKSIIDNEFIVDPDGNAFSWEMYAYDAVKDSALSFIVTEFEAYLDGYFSDNDLEEDFSFSDLKPITVNHIDSDSAAFLIDAEGGLEFRSKLSELDSEWYWEMELEILHNFFDYPLDNTPNAPVTWRGDYYAWAYDEGSESFLMDSLIIYLDAETGAVLYSSIPVSNEDEPETPEEFSLSQNYPNPFNPTTNIPFTLSEASRVEISVYSILGQKVATIVNGLYPVGSHNIQWDARNLASGVYIYRMQAGGFTQTKKMILLK
ncbi:MAG: T9SS type A sorting domain-containing protein [Balneolaceae bacterium]